ncbi:hypothetical protein MN116_004756 [Schistosoma mekongi]|uniref:Uncharacterized protein n=1 Tax=Schistosoma mekongi TaxID=38744 RepID=A0AAE1ZCH2_SCHME|nr:hypothetical protein MN116_004756 [Schistosoma mekongi]
MSMDCSSECGSVVFTDICVDTNNKTISKQSQNLTNLYDNMKHPGLTPSITAYRWITSQPTLPKYMFNKIKDEAIAQWLSVDTTDDWLMHIPKRSIRKYDKNCFKNWQSNYLEQKHSCDEDTFTTSYSICYPAKYLDERTKSRPTSANRRHNPQPSKLFLTLHLHKLPKTQEIRE